MVVLGVDHGKKRVGLAISDSNSVHAFPLEVVPGKDRHKLMLRILEVVEERGVSEVVVGLPLTMAGEVGPQASRVVDFVERLAGKLGNEIIVTTWDERLSSAQADQGRPDSGRGGSRDGVRDMMAAVVILQSYLDRKH